MVQYLYGRRNNRASFQEHWRPMYDLCHPCSIQYDYILKFEDLKEENDALLHRLIPDSQIHFPPVIKSSTKEKLLASSSSWYPELESDVRSIYDLDYLIFGYPKI